MRRAIVAGVGMTPFGKFPDRGVRSLTEEAVAAALADAGAAVDDVDMVFFGNSMSGLITGQEAVRGQVALRNTGLLGRPVINVENACASGSSAVHLAWLAVASGQCDVALAVGAERLTHADKSVSFKAMESAVDVEELAKLQAALAADGSGGNRSFFMDIYADYARSYMQKSGATPADFADIAVKSHRAGALNPKAQYRDLVTRDQVLASRMIKDPLTLLMCSPIGDGAAAVLVVSEERARKMGCPMVQVRASVLLSGGGDAEIPSVASRAAAKAYEMAGVGPEEVHVVELHDAAAPSELALYEELQLCPAGGGPELLRSGATQLGGRVAVNSSGGLLSKGHPVGASGCAQIVELVDQLRGRCGPRQRQGAKVALADNNGGYVGRDGAAAVVTILST